MQIKYAVMQLNNSEAKIFVIKLLRAVGGCLGIDRR